MAGTKGESGPSGEEISKFPNHELSEDFPVPKLWALEINVTIVIVVPAVVCFLLVAIIVLV